MGLITISAIVGAYLIGSVSPSYIYYKKVKGRDIRETGNGNPGAANIAETAGRTPAFVIAFLDLCKGILPLFIARLLGVNNLHIIPVGIAVIAGHDWPVFLKFRGGKGTMTSLGVLMFYLPLELAIAFSLWLFIHYVLKVRFVGSVITFLAVPVFTWLISCRLMGEPAYYLFLPLGVLILFLVRMPENILNFFKSVYFYKTG